MEQLLCEEKRENRFECFVPKVLEMIWFKHFPYHFLASCFTSQDTERYSILSKIRIAAWVLFTDAI